MNMTGAVRGEHNLTILFFSASGRMQRASSIGVEDIAMTYQPIPDAQPIIQIRESDADRVTNLAMAAQDRLPQVSALLLGELNRADVVPDAELSRDIVTMQSTVKFIDEASGVERTLKLVYPTESDVEAGRISILSLVGAGLLGLKTGQSIMWPDRTGKQRPLRIIEVMQG